MSLGAHPRFPLLAAAAYGLFCLVWLLGGGLLIWFGLDVEALSLADAVALAACDVIAFSVLSAAPLSLLLRRMQAGRGAESPLRVAADAAPVGIALADRMGLLSYANPAFLRMFGLGASAVGTAPLQWLITHHLVDGDSAELLPDSGEVSRRLRLRSSASRTDLAVRITRLRHDAARNGEGWMLSVQDVTAEREATHATSIYMHAMQEAADGIVIARIEDANALVTYVNKAFEEITGYAAAELIGRDLRFLQGNDRMQPEVQAIRRALQHRQPVHVTLRNYQRDGTMFWNEMRLSPLPETPGMPQHYVATIRDITRLHDATAQLERLGGQDPLTELANRARFTADLDALLAGGTGPVVVMTLDISRFHDINISFGYSAGDALLRQTADRLRATVPGRHIGRLGSNEFVVAVPVGSDAEADSIVRHIAARLWERFTLPGASPDVHFAIGFTVSKPGDTAREAMQQAGVGLHLSKSSPVKTPRRFDSVTDTEIKTRVRLIADLHQSLANRDFALHYQPKVALGTGAVVGGEALIRWRHPAFGLQPPERFVPLAEQTGLMLEIGEWVLREAAGFAARLNRNRARSLPVAVNISPMQFLHRDMAEVLDAVLRESGAEASWLVLELTESLFADASGRLLATLQELRRIGVGLAIDDFGTGYSSLAYLGAFPVTEIKLDQRFVKDAVQDTVRRTIVESVARMGRVLGAGVTAEGIETQAEAQAVAELGCPYGQGFLFSMSLPPEDFLWLVDTYTTLPVEPDAGRRRNAA